MIFSSTLVLDTFRRHGMDAGLQECKETACKTLHHPKNTVYIFGDKSRIFVGPTGVREYTACATRW